MPLSAFPALRRSAPTLSTGLVTFTPVTLLSRYIRTLTDSSKLNTGRPTRSGRAMHAPCASASSGQQRSVPRQDDRAPAQRQCSSRRRHPYRSSKLVRPPHDGQPAYLAITILRLRGETSTAAFPAPPRAPGH